MYLMGGAGTEPARNHPGVELLKMLGLDTVDPVGAQAGNEVPGHSGAIADVRLDFILPNYTTDPSDFWAQMRSLYEAHFVVVDAKNWSGPIDKDEILKIANYLSPHGAGLFGLIISRGGGDDSAQNTMREQWRDHRKMITIFDDSEIKQTLTMRRPGRNPAALIRQKIEDFRLRF